MNQIGPDSERAASDGISYQPIITVSVVTIAICASWLPTSGNPSPMRTRA